MTETLRIAETTILLGPSPGETKTYIDGLVVYGFPQNSEHQLETARDLGYGDDVALMCSEHEVTHTLLASWLGLPYSPVMKALSEGRVNQDWRGEESAVLAIQRVARQNGVSLLDVARAQGKD